MIAEYEKSGRTLMAYRMIELIIINRMKKFFDMRKTPEQKFHMWVTVSIC